MNLAAYHESRSIGHQPFASACYAPFVGLAFDMQGIVSVCAFTRTTPLGRIGEQDLRTMWTGPVIEALRAAVRADVLERSCSRCLEEIQGGNLHGVLAEGFDRFRADLDPPWPTRMEFALSNACNLQCVMCNGNFSSAIRAHREGLPPLRSPYDEAFLEELTPFLAHLEQARFLGGEPFLAEENFRIWERMVEIGASAECNVTTNGTQWSPRIEAVLDQLPFSIGVSIDGVRPATVESIRSGASYDRIMANLDRFLAYRERGGTSVSLTFCLMVENWREFGAYLRFADDRDCQVYVNTVRQPRRHSLYQLGTAELTHVVAELEHEGEQISGGLRLNQAVWNEQVARLRHHLEARDPASEDAPPSDQWRTLLAAIADPAMTETQLGERLRSAAEDGRVSMVRMDRDDRLVEGDDYLGIDVAPLLGGPSNVLFGRLAEHHGHQLDVLDEQVTPGAVARVMAFGEPDGVSTVILTVTRAGPAPFGSTRFSALLSAGRRARAAPVPPPRRRR